MNDAIICARELTKIYRLYTKPHFRFLDMFGLLRSKEGTYSEHAALADINVKIGRNEKVAIIGRNGAGKSTLLKLIAKVIEPTSGTIETAGNVNALLQIGTGFHPDFTGKENVYSYLAHLGITGKEADRRYADVVDFAEIEEYIDQPVKTYSTGMAVRLMFATSTAIDPDILVIDEVLGVGDAYFANKSYERIRELCDVGGTTVVLVSHDIYSAAKLCNRMIWIDHGRVVIDDHPSHVVRMYEESVREQEESRLRKKRLSELARLDGAKKIIIGHIAPKGGGPFSCPVFVAKFDIVDHLSGNPMARCPMTEGEFSDVCRVVTGEQSNWSLEGAFHLGRQARELLPHGSIFQKGMIEIDASLIAAALRGYRIAACVSIAADVAQELEIAMFDDENKQKYAGTVALKEGGVWTDLLVPLCPESTKPQSDKSIFGNGRLRITDVEFLDSRGDVSHVFHTGEDFRMRVHFKINDTRFNERPTFIITFQRLGLVTHLLWCDKLLISYDNHPEGVVDIVAAPSLVGQGDYIVSVSIYQEGAWRDGAPVRYFATNPDILDFHAKAYELKVLEPRDYPILRSAIFQQPSTWSIGEQVVSVEAVRSSR